MSKIKATKKRLKADEKRRIVQNFVDAYIAIAEIENDPNVNVIFTARDSNGNDKSIALTVSYEEL